MRVVAVTLAAIMAAGPAFAHHGWTAYEEARQQKVTGTVADLKWEQPHGIVWINSDGKKLEIWLSPIQRMVDRGLLKDALATGKTITVDAQPHATNAGEWKALAITVDGKDYNLMR